jgi:hypothetical protein
MRFFPSPRRSPLWHSVRVAGISTAGAALRQCPQRGIDTAHTVAFQQLPAAVRPLPLNYGPAAASVRKFIVLLLCHGRGHVHVRNLVAYGNNIKRMLAYSTIAHAVH